MVWFTEDRAETRSEKNTSANVSSLSEEISSFSAVVLTGGSSGIGKSFINLMRNQNAEPVVCNLSRRKPRETGEINFAQKLNHFPCDLSRAAEVARVAGEVQAFLAEHVPTGRLLLVNNSGFGAYGEFPEPNLAHHLEMVDVNVRAVVHLTGLLLPLLKARGGAIVTVASIAAFQPTPYMATYGATKAFVLHWSLALNEELRGTGVRTLAVCPGPTSTEFSVRAGLRPGSAPASLSMTSDAVAMAALRALAAGRAQVVPGWTNQISAFAAGRISKPQAARLGARVLVRFRAKKVSP